MKNSILAFIIVTAVISCSCADQRDERVPSEKSGDFAQVEAKAQLAVVPSSDLYSDSKARLIKTVDYRFEVENVKKSTEAIEVFLKKYPAYISSSNLHLENLILENKMKIRVQSQYFTDLLKEIDGQAKFVNFREVKTNDVAKEFVDLESRLKTKREVEERYNDILRKKAGTIEELLKAEAQIGELHEEIEATISRINFLKDQESYSTINLEFYQRIEQQITSVDSIPWSNRFASALESGLNGVLILGVVITHLWPIVVIGGIAGLCYKFLKRKKSTILKQA